MTLSNPNGAPGDLGEVIACHYRTQGNTVIMCDASGEPNGKSQRIAPNENALQAAARFAKKIWRAASDGDGKVPPGFNRPLVYARGCGVA